MLNLDTEAVLDMSGETHKNNANMLATSICRLCHRSELSETSPNIYETVAEFDKTENGAETLIADLCLNLLGVQYERHEFLPERICLPCLDMLEDFYEQRRSMQEREHLLQQDLHMVIKLDPKFRPGLNGNPGIFQPEDDCEIIDVDPDQLFESSEDEDFLIGSDVDDEDDDDEDVQHEEDVDMPLGMDAAQMHTLMRGHQTVETGTSVSADMHPKSAFLCQFCDLAFTLQEDCRQHELNSHDSTTPYSCNYCQLGLSTRPALISHIKELHDADRPYVCAQCSKGFCRRSDLKKHTIVHTGVRPYTCHVCYKSFSRNTNLTKHLRIHSSVKPFVCQQCPRSFQTPLELMKHTRSHAEVKPFQCTRCPSSFSRRDKLQMHMQVHDRRDVQQKSRIGNVQISAEQLPMPLHPYVESSAESAYLNYSQQQQTVAVKQQHIPRPSGKPSRNFRCDVCDKAFQRERDLQRHRALHLDSLFACKICGQGFNRPEKLQRHELEAHGPNYTCAICCITFLHQSDLETHIKVHELQHSVAKSAQEALNASVLAPQVVTEQATHIQSAVQDVVQQPIRPSAAEISFYSNMIPTMNLGFYSETRPEDRNGT